jgi:hypothetical protein
MIPEIKYRDFKVSQMDLVKQNWYTKTYLTIDQVTFVVKIENCRVFYYGNSL